MGFHQTSDRVLRKIIRCFILIKLVAPLGYAIYNSDVPYVEEKFEEIFTTASTFCGIKFFHRDSLCGRFSKHNRQNMCKKIINDADYKGKNPDVFYDSSRANLTKENCQIISKSIKSTEMAGVYRSKVMKLFQCPFTKADGTSGIFRASRGVNSNSAFLYDFNDDSLIGFYERV